MNKNQDIEKILFRKRKLIKKKKKIKKIARQVSKDYGQEEVIVVGVLKGCIPFFHELFSRLTCKAKMDFMLVSSYAQGARSTGDPKIILDLITNIENKNVLLVDDLIDQGHTLDKTKNLLLTKKPKTIKIATLFSKKGVPEQKKVKIDYCCFEFGGGFIVGFGFDYKENYRNLPYVGILKKEIYDNIN